MNALRTAAPPGPSHAVTPTPSEGPATRLLRWLWADRRWALVAAAGIPVVTGLLVAVVMPRGPVTASQALGVMLLSAVVGFTVGLALRSRWRRCSHRSCMWPPSSSGGSGLRDRPWTASACPGWRSWR